MQTYLIVSLRAGAAWAVARLQQALTASGGSVTSAANALGLSAKTLYNLRHQSPDVDGVMSMLAMGRAGAAGAARARRRIKTLKRSLDYGIELL